MVLSGLVSLVLLAAPQAAGPPGIEIGLVPVVRTTQPPAIDGQAEEAWSAAVKRRLERSKGPVPQSGDLQGSFRAMWDDAALYLFVEVLDDRKVKNQVNPWLDDSVEVYVDGDASRGDTYDDRNDHQYVFVWNDPTVHEAEGTGRDRASASPRRSGSTATAWRSRCRGRRSARRGRPGTRSASTCTSTTTTGPAARTSSCGRTRRTWRTATRAASGGPRCCRRRGPSPVTPPPSRRPRRDLRGGEARARGRLSASSTTTSGPTRPA